MPIKTLLLSDIEIDGNTQARVGINQEVVDNYAALYAAGVDLPAAIVFHDGKKNWLADGFHRYEAKGKSKTGFNIKCDVRKGTLRDAILYSLSANVQHGLNLSNEDKRKAVLTMLNDPEWSELSNHKIAAHCGCSHMTVGRMRNPEPETKPAAPKAAPSDKPASTASSAPAVNLVSPQSAGLGAKPSAPVAAQKHVDAEQVLASKDAAAQPPEPTELDALKATLARQEGWLRRIGVAMGEDDFSKLPALVEAMKRGVKA